MLLEVRNRFNHLILNKLLVLRYHVKKRPHLIKFIMLIEIIFTKLGFIYYGHRKL